MCRYGLGFTANRRWPILLLLFTVSIILRATAKPDPESNSTRTDNVDDYVHNNDTDPLHSNQTEFPTGLPANPSTSPTPTGPNTPTKQPFDVLATDVEYFGYDGYSEEVVKEGTGIEGDVDMDTNTEPGEQFSPAGNS